MEVLEIAFTEILKAFGLVMIFFGTMGLIGYLAELLNVQPPKFICDIVKTLKKHTDEESRENNEH